jgi:hypothetical protein
LTAATGKKATSGLPPRSVTGAVLDRTLLDIVATDSDLGASLVAARNERIREFGDRIETGSVDDNSISARWKAACRECNAAVQALGCVSRVNSRSQIIQEQDRSSKSIGNRLINVCHKVGIVRLSRPGIDQSGEKSPQVGVRATLFDPLGSFRTVCLRFAPVIDSRWSGNR